MYINVGFEGIYQNKVTAATITTATTEPSRNFKSLSIAYLYPTIKINAEFERFQWCTANSSADCIWISMCVRVFQNPHCVSVVVRLLC